MVDPLNERWPPVYDAEDLAAAIEAVLSDLGTRATFFATARSEEPSICQGDIVRLEGPVPCFDARGDPVATGEFRYWMVIGNTCDFVRDVSDVRWSQLVPLVNVAATGEPDATEQAVLTRYQYTRRFYVPPWSDAVLGTWHVADFTQPVSIDKSAFSGPVAREARISKHAWVLLHSCLVRFLARDDGRRD